MTTLIPTIFGILFIFSHTYGAENQYRRGHYQRIVQTPRDMPKNRVLYRPSIDQGKGNGNTESFRSLEENNEYFKKTVPRVEKEPSEESDETYEENQPRFSPSRPSRYLLRPPTSSQRKSLQQNRNNEETSHSSRRWLLQPKTSTTRRSLFRQKNKGNTEIVANETIHKLNK
ncbi:MAG: hypothetical protein WD595_05535 [Waddliaceae bacterium]